MVSRLAIVPEEVVLLLSGGCNLSCAYCYLDRGRPRGGMSRQTLTAALGAALEGNPPRLGIEFTGGEPLLRADLLRWAVDLIERRRSEGTVVEFSLTTNGTLLGPALLAFLFAHGFTIRLSFDGIPAAQDLRGQGTFEGLDRLLDYLRAEFPNELRDRVTVAMTIAAAAIPHMAASVRYFVAKGAGRVAMGPRLTWDPGWGTSSRYDLERQVDEILAISVDHWRRTGAVPVGFLARSPLRDRDAPVGNFLCGAPTGTAFCVTPEGRGVACTLFAASLSPLPAAARQASRALDLGPVGGPEWANRLSGLPSRATGLRIFTDLLAKHSSYGACADCRFVADCHVCPASICHIPGTRDPDLVPDFICAFNYVTLAARERFDELTGGEVSAAWYRGMEAALGRLEAALRDSRESAETETSGPPARRHRLSARGSH
jgi:sulfatase maturation enzyme AslB (radical SAM superfamily)